ncbi:hypothetical protein [Salicibibacter kimchii]|uniref:Uncharacterized protein n=1 Tax=Salicibibacter kimchii TaxID=2099786 RepID=A0A345C2L4_9BACI|nr:hypothetical protein [Salicibibacter kimchii]AXF57445.1 hypothetical protein DT065_16605 [Salicibibacter kimchii]
MIYDECQTDIGCLRFVLKENGTLARVFLTDHHWFTFVEINAVKKSSEVGKIVREQFQEYLGGERKYLNLKEHHFKSNHGKHDKLFLMGKQNLILKLLVRLIDPKLFVP